jgi:LPXTG-motif cell wall-anchored protein
MVANRKRMNAQRHRDEARPKEGKDMTKRISVASAILAGWAIALAGLLLTLAPIAMAHHSADHDKGKGHNASQGQGGGGDRDGDADRDPGTKQTEETDNDGTENPNDTPSQHPSGKDNTAGSGKSGNQGKSESDPDDNVGPQRRECSDDGPTDPRSGCTDKPGGAGGEYVTDQDGNNGCGNDQDFDDDNNGWCGKPKDDVGGNVIDNDEEEVVEGGVIKNPSFPGRRPPTDSVLGGRLVNEAAPDVESEVLSAPSQEEGAVLPFTGAGISIIVLTGLALITAGGVLTRRRK